MYLCARAPEEVEVARDLHVSLGLSIADTIARGCNTRELALLLSTLSVTPPPPKEKTKKPPSPIVRRRQFSKGFLVFF
jgi:hypothetical protein